MSQRLPANFPLTGVFLSDLEWGLVKFTQRARDITVYTGTTDQSFSYPSAKELWFGGLEKASGEEKQICIRPCLHGEKFIRVEGSHAYTSYSERANFLYISLQNVASRLHYIHTYILYWLVPTGLFRVNFTLQNYKPSS